MGCGAACCGWDDLVVVTAFIDLVVAIGAVALGQGVRKQQFGRLQGLQVSWFCWIRRGVVQLDA